jgi:phosphoribosylanthranilate isomerase
MLFMALTIKICGLKTPETLDAALDAGADWVAFNFFPKSPRYVTLETAKALAQRIGGRAKRVALLVDAEDSTISDVVAALKPDFLQLHGHETVERIAIIREKFGVPVIKAVGIADSGDLVHLRRYERVADWLLLDAKPPKDAPLLGGNGVTFDWHVLAGLDLAKPFMVSGGLNPSNVAKAIAVSKSGGVDVSSGVESAPGVKDTAKIKAFISNARAADRLEIEKD